MNNNRVLLWIAVLAFAVTLGIIVGTRLAGATLLAVALGVAVGVSAGVITGGIMTWLNLRSGQPQQQAGLYDDSTHTAIIMTNEQANRLFKILGSRKQSAPHEFPMVAEGDRDFIAVGGAEFDDTAET